MSAPAPVPLFQERPACRPPIGAGAYYRWPVLATVAAGSLLQGIGVYWDIAFHIEVGRDKLFSAPHNAILAGMTLVGASALLAAGYGRGNPAIRKAAGLTLSGVVIQIVALAVVDDWWHRVYGLDVTLWSPPHLLTLFAAFVALFGFLLGASYEAERVSRLEAALGMGLGTTNMLILMNVTLAEYNYSFPQYRLAYQPVVLAGTTLFCLMLTRRVLAYRLAATTVAVTFMLLRLGMWPVLGVLDRTLRPYFPAAVVAGLVIDLLADRTAPNANAEPAGIRMVVLVSALATLALLAAEPGFETTLGRASGLPETTFVLDALTLGALPAIGAGVAAGVAGWWTGSLLRSVRFEGSPR